MTLGSRLQISALVLAGCLATGRAPAATATVNRTFAFEIDKWYALDDVKEGPVTLHRIEVQRQKGLFTKSTLIRPGNTEFLASIEIRLEYSNTATRDWKATLHVALLDAADVEIDGFNGKEQLGEAENHNLVTVKLSTLKYGLDRAKKLRVVIECEPE